MRRFLKLIGLFLLLTGSIHAQTNTGEVRGVIRDATGGVIPSTSVSARHPETGLLVARVTDSEGRFFFPGLQPGQWEITASVPGFETLTQRVPLEIGRTVDLEFTLVIQGIAQEVAVVNGNAPRNSVLGPGSAALDIAVAKQWSLGEPSRLEFRWEVFNVFNRANFDVPNRIFGNPKFGRIFSAKSP